MSNDRVKRAARLGLSVLIAAAGGWAAHAVGLPAAWLSGAMLATAVWALAGGTTALPQPVLMLVYFALGISMGSAVTPETVQHLSAWPLSIAGVAVTTLMVTLAVTHYLCRIHGIEPQSAFFAAVPGALSYVMALAIERKIDVRAVAVIQTLRLIMLIAALPLLLTSMRGAVAPVAAVQAPEVSEALLLLLVGGIGAGIFHRFRWPGGILVGAMIASGIVHGAGLVHGRLPDPLLAVAFITLGMVVGGQFAGTDLKLLRRLLLAGLGAFILAMLISLACALVVAKITGLPRADVIVAYAPGALEAMVVLAFSLHLDPAYVGAHHLARFVMIAFSLPFVASFMAGSAIPPIDQSHANPSGDTIREKSRRDGQV